MLLSGLLPVAGADCIPLQRVDINEAEILSAADRQALVSPLLGSCIEADLLRALLSALSDFYIERGYITTRPYLPEQDVNDGGIEIRVVVGRIEGVIDAATGDANARIASAFLFTGDVLNLRDLETALEAIQRPPSVSANFEIRPGAAPGGSVIAIETTEQRRYRSEFGVNAQSGLDAQLSFRLAFDNPLNINDIIEFRRNSGDVRETLQSNDSSELVYSFALGDMLFELSRSEIEYEQRVQGINESFVSSGEADTDMLRVSKLLRRSQNHRFGLALALQLKDSRNFFEDQVIDVSSYRTAQARAELRLDSLRRWGQVVTILTYHRGLDSYGARDDDYFSPEGGFDNEARLQFDKIDIDSRLVYFMSPAWQLNMNLFLQYSDDILFPDDKLNLGSPFTVRGYSSALSGSNAGYLRTDLVRQFQDPTARIGGIARLKTIALSIGIDYGEAECESDNRDACGDIYGIGAGIEIADANFNARLLWGHPLKRIGDDIGDREQFLLDVRWLF